MLFKYIFFILLLLLIYAEMITLHVFSSATYFLSLLSILAFGVYHKKVKLFLLKARLVLPALLIVSIITIQYKLPISFAAQQLECSGLIFIAAIFLIIPNLLLRLNLKGKAPVISLKALGIPLFIILFMWGLNYLGYLSQGSASNISYIAVLGDWEDINSKVEEYFFSSLDKGQKATIGGATFTKTPWETNLNKLIPSNFFMEEGYTGSRKRPLPDSPGEESASKRSNLTSASQSTRSNLITGQATNPELIDAPLLASYPRTVEQSVALGATAPALLDGSENLPRDIKDLSLHTKTIRGRYTFTNHYRGERGFILSRDEQGFQYIPFPKQLGSHTIGFSGFVSYKGSPGRLTIDKVTVWDPDGLVFRGWCSDGTLSNQPAARRFADLLLAVRANGHKWVSGSMLEFPEVEDFLQKAGNFSNTKGQKITDRLITALRLSK